MRPTGWRVSPRPELLLPPRLRARQPRAPRGQRQCPAGVGPPSFHPRFSRDPFPPCRPRTGLTKRASHRWTAAPDAGTHGPRGAGEEARGSGPCPAPRAGELRTAPHVVAVVLPCWTLSLGSVNCFLLLAKRCPVLALAHPSSGYLLGTASGSVSQPQPGHRDFGFPHPPGAPAQRCSAGGCPAGASMPKQRLEGATVWSTASEPGGAPQKGPPGRALPHCQLCPHSPAYTQQILSPNETAAPQ